MYVRLRRIALSSLAVVAFGCKPSASSETPQSEAPSEAEASAGEPGPTPTTAERPSLSEQACAERGGVVVGDIGDGAIHRPDYACESGAPPIGTIVADEGGPMGVEGAVCCPA